ncbi:sensor histidine kinase [Nocardioides zeicaulis]|uniref:histidine kinase n=1 Tax=Nocardioides zeicaulis TaxID=1776857 RepID=A0ABV6E014_9ACTN
MIQHPALQDVSAAPVSGDGAALAREILDGDAGVGESIARVAAHLLTDPRVEVVVGALTVFSPEDRSRWIQLGGRAWVQEWVRPGSGFSGLPPAGAGAEAALSMPWLSRLAREDTVVLMDRDLLPSAADVDRDELARFGVRSLIGSTLTSRGEMFGSLSAISLEAGPWPEELVEDVRLLTAAVSSRITLEHSRRALAEAIDTGTEAQLAYQQFFAAVGHELRTPLAAIVGYTEVLMDDATQQPDDPVSKGLLRDGPVILRAADQLVSVVDSLLGAGRTLASDDERHDVVVADAVADVVHWHRAPARNAGVTIHTDIDPTLTVWAHEAGVRQVLTNLLGNAIAYHRPEGGSVHLSATTLLGESGRPMVRVIVRDDGPGLAPEQLQRVFEPFVRFAGPSTKGSGLGLSISRTIAERDGGAVQGESTLGSGTSFWLELPAQSTQRP